MDFLEKYFDALTEIAQRYGDQALAEEKLYSENFFVLIEICEKMQPYIKSKSLFRIRRVWSEYRRYMSDCAPTTIGFLNEIEHQNKELRVLGFFDASDNPKWDKLKT